jgi:hypothetical protein
MSSKRFFDVRTIKRWIDSDELWDHICQDYPPTWQEDEDDLLRAVK